MAVRKIEQYCNGCGYTIMTKYLPYANNCPFCGEAMGVKELTSTGRKPVENKKQSAKEKK